MRMYAPPDGKHVRLCGVDVSHTEIEVELLRMLATRPGWNEPVVDPLERESGSPPDCRGHATSRRHEGRGEKPVRTVLEGPTQEIGVELGKVQGIGAVEDHRIELRA